MSESSSRSWRAASSAEAKAMEPNGLPLICCPMCKREQVLELVSKKSNSYMERFFKCPKKYIVDPLCSYYLWGDDYAEELEKKGLIGTDELRQYLLKQDCVRQEVKAKQLKQEVESLRKDLGGVDELKEEMHVLRLQLGGPADLKEDIQMLRMGFVEHRQMVESSMQMVIRCWKIVVALCTVTAMLVLIHVLSGTVN